jgi:plasmid stabilization system protein ParE
MRISWTLTARISYFKVLDHLEENWTKKEVENFINEVETLLDQISSNPEMFQVSRKRRMLERDLSPNTIHYTTESNPGRRSLN